MRTADGYKTRQRAVIEDVLACSADRHFTVDSLVAVLNGQGEAVGRTTVWRCLEKLSDEGRVRKYVQSGESACYQYISQDGCHEHFHLKCEKCGKLIHMQCETLKHLGTHIEKEHAFRVNPLKTVLYGVCKECAEK